MGKSKKPISKDPKQVDSFDDFLETLDSESGDEVDLDDENIDEGSEDESVDQEVEYEVGSDNLPVDEDDVSETEAKEESDDENEAVTMQQHKKSLKKLAETDPDFFAFLKENDAELLGFDDSQDESDSEEEDPIHKPSEELEVASDSEAEEDLLDEDSLENKSSVESFMKKRIVNLVVLRDWENKLSKTRDLTVFTNVIDAFDCAVQILQGETDGLKWRVEGSTNFNALIRLCIKHLKGFCVRFLMGNNNVLVSENRFDQRPFEIAEKSKQKWSKLRPKIKAYMKNIVSFLKSMGNPEAITAILRHCQKMSGFWALMASKSYKLLRVLINIWSQGEDSCRVLAFLTIIRITNFNKDAYLLRVYKQMYLAYVSNCKFTSVNTWAAINFMRSSLAEVYLLDTAAAYSVAFPFIRQLAIHLRNAVTTGTSQQAKQSKKDASRIVYSWQYLHSLHAWVDLLAQSRAGGSDNLKLLIYPVVQICLGTLKLIPTRKYIPLRFHIVRMLINLQEKTKVFIPILPLATEVLNLIDFNSKSVSKFSVRPLDLNCCLKAEPAESGYFRAVADSVYESILGACKAVATELSFPEIVTPTLMQLRNFVKKKCKNAEMSKKLRTLIEKIDANSRYINEKRTKALEEGKVSIQDQKSQQILRVQMETNKPYPPIIAFANEYFKVNAKVAAKLRKINIETKEEKLIPKPVAATKNRKVKKDEVFEKPMFSTSEIASGSEESDEEFQTKFDAKEEDENESTPKAKKTKNLKRKVGKEKDKVPMKIKKKKAKISHDSTVDVDDELVDFELSD